MPNETPAPQTLEALLTSDPAKLAELNALIDKRAQARVDELLDAEKRKQKIADFAASYMGGSEDDPRGLGMTAADLTNYLQVLPVEQLDPTLEILEKVKAAKVVDFTERGHSRTLQGVRELPEPIKATLKSWLDNGGKLDEFFRVNAVELGAQSDYNLSEFQPKEK